MRRLVKIVAIHRPIFRILKSLISRPDSWMTFEAGSGRLGLLTHQAGAEDMDHGAGLHYRGVIAGATQLFAAPQKANSEESLRRNE